MADANEWEPFADLIEPGDLPTFGFRVLVRIGAEGEINLDHAWAGEKVPGYLMVGAVMGAVIERFHDHLHEADE